MLVGALTGFVTQRYRQFPSPNRASVWLFVLVAATLSSTVERTRAQSPAPVDTLGPVPLGRPVDGHFGATTRQGPGRTAIRARARVEVHPGSKPKYLPPAREEPEGRNA